MVFRRRKLSITFKTVATAFFRYLSAAKFTLGHHAFPTYNGISRNGNSRARARPRIGNSAAAGYLCRLIFFFHGKSGILHLKGLYSCGDAAVCQSAAR